LKFAFYFYGDALVIPADASDYQAFEKLPLELSAEFDNPDIFEIPSLVKTDSVITAVSVTQDDLPSGWRSIPVRRLLSLSGNQSIENIIRACHISQWRQESRFCGKCGAENMNISLGLSNQAQCECPGCGRQEFPRICPAVITAVTDDKNRILLAHNKKFRAGVFSLISGFSEAGETLERTVMREIREEVNIEVRNIVYVKSQPWPFPNSLMIGFKAVYASGIIKPDGEEIDEAAWFTPGNLPELPGEGSLSRYLINDWLKNK